MISFVSAFQTQWQIIQFFSSQFDNWQGHAVMCEGSMLSQTLQRGSGRLTLWMARFHQYNIQRQWKLSSTGKQSTVWRIKQIRNIHPIDLFKIRTLLIHMWQSRFMSSDSAHTSLRHRNFHLNAHHELCLYVNLNLDSAGDTWVTTTIRMKT